jgi:hypothetical protein
MRRREFITLVAGAGRRGRFRRAQQPGRMWRITDDAPRVGKDKPGDD